MSVGSTYVTFQSLIISCTSQAIKFIDDLGNFILFYWLLQLLRLHFVLVWRDRSVILVKNFFYLGQSRRYRLNGFALKVSA